MRLLRRLFAPRDEASHEEARANTTTDESLPLAAGPITIPIEDVIDLHSFIPREIPSVVADYVEAAARAGFREVRLIHGRGRGVQRRCVRDALARHALVERFADAPPERGGWGATIAWLKRTR